MASGWDHSLVGTVGMVGVVGMNNCRDYKKMETDTKRNRETILIYFTSNDKVSDL